MKKGINIIGFVTALLLFMTVVMKSNHLPGAGMVMALSGFAISVYLPFFLLYNPNGSETPVNSSIKIGALSGSVLNLGITFKFQHWPGASVMIVLGLTSFALIFIPLFLKYKLNNEGSERKTLMNTLGASGLTLFALGLLFKIMHWPGAAVMLGLSVLFLFCGYFLMYLLDKSIDNDSKTIYLRKAFFSIIIGSIVATCLLIDLNRPWFKQSPAQAMLEREK
ncbi:MAG: gliding motility-associated protein GldL [Bacteroidota bacterium]|jgi:hypothetical protein|nr:gliding motility-associated protein GldL [Bacteroidota bacterium]